jgi:hypothetical protein
MSRDHFTGGRVLRRVDFVHLLILPKVRPEIQQFEIDLTTGKSLSGEPKKL